VQFFKASIKIQSKSSFAKNYAYPIVVFSTFAYLTVGFCNDPKLFFSKGSHCQTTISPLFTLTPTSLTPCTNILYLSSLWPKICPYLRFLSLKKILISVRNFWCQGLLYNKAIQWKQTVYLKSAMIAQSKNIQ